MPRGQVGAGDRALIEDLGERGVAVSVSQLERWRAQGLLPRNQRSWPGRPSGSTSAPHPDALAIAEALALHQRTGRSAFKAALQVFVNSPHVPLPEQGVRAALEWYVRRQRTGATLITDRVPAGGDPDAVLDAAYSVVTEAISRVGGRRGRVLGISLFAGRIDTAAVEEALPTLLVAQALGVEAVGRDAYWDALHTFFQLVDPGALPHSDWESVRASIERDMDANGAHSVPSYAPRRRDLEVDLEKIRQAPIDLLHGIRNDLLALIDASAKYLAATALIPDHPAVQEWTRILASDPLVRAKFTVLGPISIASPAQAWKQKIHHVISTLTTPGSVPDLARTITILSPSLNDLPEVAAIVRAMLGLSAPPDERTNQ
ncbi:hypothetical protein ACIBKY_55215 [Nonomuraea sp. NPDC050394]|uniref:hypothetical protein n=1 Tax=Nonomuraea sp. NPDC050394 TaxID=3364363 RepID=UPI00378E57BF